MREYRIVQQAQGTFYCREYFYFEYFEYIFLIILTDFYLSNVFDCFSVVLLSLFVL